LRLLPGNNLESVESCKLTTTATAVEDQNNPAHDDGGSHASRISKAVQEIKQFSSIVHARES
jgi:hypothetical protein